MPTASVGIETSLKLALLHKADYKPSYGSKVQRSDVSTPPSHPVQVEVFGCTDCSTHAGMSVQALTHAQKVTRLYRKSLKHLLSWKIYRSAWRLEALDLRSIFDENKKIKDVAKATSLLEQGEACFNMWKHPDPYISPEAPEGSKWERNLPPPPHVLEMTPEEKQWFDDWMKNAPR